MTEEKIKQEVKEEPKEQLTKEDLKPIVEAILNLNNQIEVLKQQPKPIQQEQPQQQQKMDLSALLPLLAQQGDNPMDRFYRDVGERVFLRIVDKMLPSRKEIRGEGGKIL